VMAGTAASVLRTLSTDGNARNRMSGSVVIAVPFSSRAGTDLPRPAGIRTRAAGILSNTGAPGSLFQDSCAWQHVAYAHFRSAKMRLAIVDREKVRIILT
jgi:hypothetical protein